ncbi:Octanoyltransferase [Ewingella americana]|uniref:Octanoyltransferase n=1 Tax=Ewingella americana TaxID=41202 RepID=A0A377NG96_9GAMM|nr:Octanoyltransferase [Ewingella americana]
MYVMVDLKRKKLGVRQLVTAIEQTVVDTLAHFSIEAYPRADAPGVYVDRKKNLFAGSAYPQRLFVARFGAEY